MNDKKSVNTDVSKKSLPSSHEGGVVRGVEQESKIIRAEMMYSGPVPPPELFAGFERALPGLADRVMKMSETQSRHRQKIESRVVTFDMIKSFSGLIFAFLIVCAGIGSGTYLIYHDKNISGLTAILLPLAGVIGAFVWQKKEEKEQKSEKKKHDINQD